MLRCYGVEHPSQSAILADKNRSYKRKAYVLGNSTVLVQGYEPQALDYILAEHNVKPEDIVCGVGSDVPTVKWYDIKGMLHVYRPDIFIPKFNRLIEVKSVYTLKLSRSSLKHKAAACNDLGYKFTLLVMDGSGNRL
jgi:hypothetical protein